MTYLYLSAFYDFTLLRCMHTSDTGALHHIACLIPCDQAYDNWQ